MSNSDQRWNPREYAENARFVSDLGAPVLALLAPQPGERILDLGCGDGALTKRLADAGCDVVGIDASREMIAAARALGLARRRRTRRFGAEFDAVFQCRAALAHASDEVIAGVWSALKPGGASSPNAARQYGDRARRARSVAARAIVRPAPPLVLSDGRGLRVAIAGAGFVVDSVALIPRPPAAGPSRSGSRRLRRASSSHSVERPWLDEVAECAGLRYALQRPLVGRLYQAALPARKPARPDLALSHRRTNHAKTDTLASPAGAPSPPPAEIEAIDACACRDSSGRPLERSLLAGRFAAHGFIERPRPNFQRLPEES